MIKFIVLIIFFLLSFLSFKQGNNNDIVSLQENDSIEINEKNVLFSIKDKKKNKEDLVVFHDSLIEYEVRALDYDVGENRNIDDIIDYHDSLRCNLSYVVNLSNKMDNPFENDILNFLYTFDESCNRNVEFSQFSNQILFQILFEHTDKTLKLLSYENVNTSLVIDELKMPVNDRYSNEDIMQRIKMVEEETHIKSKVLKALNDLQ